MARQSSVETVE